MSGVCARPGCERPNPSPSHSSYCTLHDGIDHGPVICVCLVARPTRGWGNQCATCYRPIAALHPAVGPPPPGQRVLTTDRRAS